jgi:hydrogenase maturation protease
MSSENTGLSDVRPVIVGVGSVLMGDDGVGPAAIEALRRHGVGRRADLIDAGLAFSEVLCDLEPSRPMVIIDAVRAGGKPGSIRRLDAAGLDPQGGSMPLAVSLHELSVLPALRMEALAGREFTDVTIFGVEPGELAWGERLSPPVAQATEQLVPAVCRYLDERAAPGDRDARPSGARPAACGISTSAAQME